jgi:hypothetical protein
MIIIGIMITNETEIELDAAKYFLPRFSLAGQDLKKSQGRRRMSRRRRARDSDTRFVFVRQLNPLRLIPQHNTVLSDPHQTIISITNS